MAWPCMIHVASCRSAKVPKHLGGAVEVLYEVWECGGLFTSNMHTHLSFGECACRCPYDLLFAHSFYRYYTSCAKQVGSTAF